MAALGCGLRHSTPEPARILHAHCTQATPWIRQAHRPSVCIATRCRRAPINPAVPPRLTSSPAQPSACGAAQPREWGWVWDTMGQLGAIMGAGKGRTDPVGPAASGTAASPCQPDTDRGQAEWTRQSGRQERGWASKGAGAHAASDAPPPRARHGACAPAHLICLEEGRELDQAARSEPAPHRRRVGGAVGRGAERGAWRGGG